MSLNTAATVRYLQSLGSPAAIMFMASNIYLVSSGTVNALETAINKKNAITKNILAHLY